MKNNNNGFAISTLLYGLTIAGVLVMLLLISTAYFTSSTSSEFVNTVENNLNDFSDRYFYNNRSCS